MIKDAMFYEKCDDKVKCVLCPHNCIIQNERAGICSVRVNKNGSLKTINYGKITSIDKAYIEKKPLYHFKPGASILSVGSFGCNFSCAYCQNYLISHNKPESEDI